MGKEHKNTKYGNTDDPGLILSKIHGKRVLDVATGTGSNIQHLKNSLGSFKEIIGIDLEKPERIKKFDHDGIFNGQNIRYIQMDAAQLKFDDCSFDVVSIGNSLHHLEDPETVLSQMFRVLEEKRWAVISEMYRNRLSPESQTHVLVHHWWAGIDSALGVTHRETYKRCDLVEMIERAGFIENKYFDIIDSESDPHDEERKKYFYDAIEKYLYRANSFQNLPFFKEQAKKLLDRIDRIGIRWSPVLLAISKKQ
ncbi:class I SAM-dependent methyltransferase [candidate division WOR-3 bacterium]|nr:class I SAM-dependent methyltransferase [candidate division WOR-3 bacterium]